MAFSRMYTPKNLYTDEEITKIMARELTLKELSVELGRSVAAISMKRSAIIRAEKNQRLAELRSKDK